MHTTFMNCIALDLPDFISVCLVVAEEIFDEFDHVSVIQSPDHQLLSYDIIFQLLDFYLPTMTFHHTLFKENPISSVAFLLHER